MLRYVGAVFTSLAVLSVGCGSSDGDDEGANGEGSGGTGGIIGVGGKAGKGSGGGAASGSVDDLRKASCAGWAAEPEALPAVLMLVVDVSGSMQSNPPNGNQSKWVITRDALAVAMDSLPATTAVGIIYYPNLGNTGTGTQPRPTSACVNTNGMIPIDLLGAAGSPHRGRIAQSLQSARTGGGTPTHDAYQYAVQNGMIPSMHTGNRFMLLITDGQPTFSLQCIGTGATSNPVPEQPIVDEIGAAHGQGIRTFVIGSPGSEQNVSTGADARPWLSRAANAGNTATPGCSDTGPNFCHMDMTQAPDFAAALRSGLAQIAGTLVSCTYDLPQPPAGQQLDLSRVNVINTPGGGQPTILPRSDDPNCTEGWYLDSNNRVVLCSETCAQVQADPQVGLEVLYGCQSVGPGPR